MRTDFRRRPEEFEDALPGIVDRVLTLVSDVVDSDRELIGGVLQAKFELDGRVGSWRRTDLVEVLDEWELVDDDLDVPVATKVFAVGLVLRWLRSEQLLDPDSDPFDVLMAEVDLLAREIADADDEDDEDELGIDAWPGLPTIEDLAGQDPDTVESRIFPPVLLPSAADLIDAAESSVLVRQVRALLLWIEDGKALADPAKLWLVDMESLSAAMGLSTQAATGTAGGQVTLVLEWARAAGLIRTAKGRLLPVKAAGPLRRKPLELWQRLFSSFEELGAVFASIDTGDRGGPAQRATAEAFGDIWAAFQVMLYESSDEPLPTELLQDLATEAVTLLGGVPDRGQNHEKAVVRSAASGALSALTRLGAIEISSVTDPDERQAIKAIAESRTPEYTAVQLTPIGRWASHQQLLEAGGDVVDARELAGRPAAEAAARLSEAAIEVSEAGWAAWVGARGEAVAARELEQALLAASDPAGRLGLVAGFSAAGVAGLAAAERLRSTGGVSGAVVIGLLVEHGVIDESAVTREESLLSVADVLTVAADDEMLFEILGEAPLQDQIELVRGIGHSGHPHALRLLDDIADAHPERRVARVAGKERLRLRSAGAG